MILKVRCLVLILIFVPTLFAFDIPIKSKWQISNELVQKDNVFFYDDYGISDNHESKSTLYLKEFLYASGGSCCCLGTPLLVVALIRPTPTIEVDTIIYFFGFPVIIIPKEPILGPEYVIPVVGLISAIILQPAIAAAGAREAAKEIDPDGSYWTSCLGATGGSILGLGIGYGTGTLLNKVFKNETVGWISGIIVYSLCNSIGAVIGYNLSVPKGGYGFLNQHFDLPSFSMKTEKTQEGKTITAVDFRLINARF